MEKTLPSNRRYCPNCHHPLSEEAKYCPQCSQKYTTGKVSIWRMFHELFESIFNVDSRIFRTLQDLFIPGKLTIAYFKGRHKRYVHPLRLFLVMGIVMVALISFLAGDQLNETILDINSENNIRDGYKSIFLEDMDTARQEIIAFHEDHPKVVTAMDSLSHKLGKNRKDSFNITYFVTYGLDSIKKKEIKIAEKDLVNLSPKEIVGKYEIEGFIGRITVKQTIKILLQSGGFSRFILGKAIWMVALMMLALALILKIFYIRRKKYYVEHLIFSFHYHSFAFLILSLAFIVDFSLLDSIDDLETGIFTGIAFLVIAIYLFVSMRRVYKQGFFKTFIKYSALNFSYLFIFILFLVLTLVVSALLF